MAVCTAGGLAVAMPRVGERPLPRPQVKTQNGNTPARVPSPALPGAVSKPPPWLRDGATFDIASFFAVPPLEENAAPRYLDALFEFGPQVEVCFPEGTDRQHRKKAVDERLGRFWPVFQSWSNDPGSVAVSTIDDVIGEFDAGFRKLDWAQQRPRCVFETGIGVTAQIPHVQVVGNVARVVRLKVQRELNRGELAAALRDLARLLRLSRDLIPRGVMIADMVSASADRSAIEDTLLPVLAAKGLTVEHCDRMQALLLEHGARSLDAYAEGLRRICSIRATLHDLVFEQDRLRKEWERLTSSVSNSIVADLAEPVLISALAENAPAPAAPAGKGLNAQAERITSLKSIPNLDARMAQHDPRRDSQAGWETR